MLQSKKNEVSYFQYSIFSNHKNKVSHFITTRQGGVSKGTYQSLNLGMMQADPVDNVIENRKRVANAFGLSLTDFVFPIQVHGTQIIRITEKDRGKGAFCLNDAFADTDGFITNVPRLCLITLAADCVPITFFDPIKKAIGVAHAGWKGTALKTPKFLIESMGREFNSNPKDIIVGIGPSGGPCCYEVGQDVVDEVAKTFDPNNVIISRSGKTFFNMWEANRITLIESGVMPTNIEQAEICTITHSDTFFSARQGHGGRFAAGIFLL